ncbi:MAG: YkgJ family cysteine cluster protein [Planctomycetota bacterium]|jgi:Fe-S-cluster containining protein
MVAGCGINTRLLKKVAEIYKNNDLSGACEACGKCCDFDGFDHHLFVTPPELMYLVAKLGKEEIKPMPSSRCPYNIDGKCSVYEYRFVGCRIFCCSADEDFQSRLSESALEKLKSICTEFQIPYRYTDLAAGLNSLAGI